MPKGTNYSLDEIDSLLDLIEDELPISATLWENIQKSHLSRYPDQRRGVDSIKRKFKELYSKRVKTGDPNCPQEVRRAKQLRHQIVESMNASDLNTVVAGSEEQGSESGDDASSLGEHDNVGSDVVVAHRPRRSSAEVDDEEVEEDDDLIAEVVDEGAGDLAPKGGGQVKTTLRRRLWLNFRHVHYQEHPLLLVLPLLVKGNDVVTRTLDAVPQSILPQFHGHEIDSVVSVTNHQRDALGTKSAR